MSFRIDTARGRIILAIFIPVMMLCSYLLYSQYQNSSKTAQEDALRFLSGVSNTVALSIDGDAHQRITEAYRQKDAITDIFQDDDYYSIFNLLKKTHDYNGFQTAIYTLVLNKENQQFEFAVASTETPFFRHVYHTPNAVLKDHFDTGAIIPAYEDEHGKWLSSFSPIKNKKGETVAVVMADLEFTSFADELWQRFVKGILISLLLVSISITIMIRFVGKTLDQEDISKEIIENQNREINRSIEYSRLIIDSAMDMREEIKKYLPQSFIFHEQKNTVGGDFYFFHPFHENESEKPTHFIVGVFDCTGHGVPGAMLSMLGYSILMDIVKDTDLKSPGKIFDLFNARMIKMMNQHSSGKSVQDSIEGCLCVFDVAQKELEIASAKRSVYIVSPDAADSLREIKGQKYPIGGGHYELDRVFESIKVPYQIGDRIMMYTDGISDQFSANPKSSKKYGSRKVRDFFANHASHDPRTLGDLFKTEFLNWKGDAEQTDDATFMLLGFS